MLLKQVEEYIKKMEFRKRGISGVDEEDVLVHIQNICNIYQQELERVAEQSIKVTENIYNEKFRKLHEEYQRRYRELNTAIDNAKAIKKEAVVVEAQNRKLKEETNRLCEQWVGFLDKTIAQLGIIRNNFDSGAKNINRGCNEKP